MKILVTGATGFVGRKLVSSLISAGHDVSALVRTTSNLEGLPKELHLFEGDMLDEPTLHAAVQGQEVVIHLAAYFDFYPRDKKLLYRVNVDGTQHLLNACVEASVRRFIYLSTTEVIGPVKNPPGTEETELRPQFHYSKSKMRAEEMVREVSSDTGLEHVILRSTGIMGEGDLYTAFEAIEAVNKREIPILPGDGEKHLMYVHIDDVVRAILAAVDLDAPVNQTIILCVDDPMTYNELFEFLGETLGVKPPRRKIPTFLAKLGIGLLSPYKNRRKTTFLWHVKTIQAMDEDRWFSNETAKRLLNWSPQITMREGIARAINWYYQEGYLEDKHQD
ncbi:MAG: NAD-dependent epimerase/dehydratase family protein [Candidatus Hodarchaeota archaeon]